MTHNLLKLMRLNEHCRPVTSQGGMFFTAESTFLQLSIPEKNQEK